jgi:Ca2+-binding RTX toxin-like protein
MSRKAPHRTTRLQFESLENRDVASITLVNHIWTATGTEESDIVIVDRQPNTTDQLRIRILDGTTGALREQPQPRLAVNVDRVVLNGLGGNDQLVNWTSKPASLFGGVGSDTLTGGFGDDSLDGGVGRDTYTFTDSLSVVNLPGGTNITVNDPNAPAFHILGTDRISRETYTLFESMRPSPPGDSIDLRGIKAGVNLDLGQLDTIQTVLTNRLALFLESNGLYAGPNDIYGTDFDDRLRGDTRDNGLLGYSGNDTLEGRGGRDRLYGHLGSDIYVYSGSGLGSDDIYEPVNDSTVSGGATDTLDFSGSGLPIDLYLDPPLNQTITVTADYYTIFSSDLRYIENVVGSRFDDRIRGNDLSNQLFGLNGNDTLEGRGGNDELFGGEGSDTYVFAGLNLGRDTVHELRSYLPGIDTLNFAGFGAAIKLDLGSSSRQTVALGNLELILDNRDGGVASIENVFGTQYDDTIYGNDLDNRIDGFFGNDTILGRGGNDTLIGGMGTDTLYGGEDFDCLYGFVPDVPSGPAEEDILRGEGGTDYQEIWSNVYVNGVTYYNVRLWWTD